MFTFGAQQITKVVETKPIFVDSKLCWEIKNFLDIKEPSITSTMVEIPDVDAVWWVTVMPKVFDGNDVNNFKTVFNFGLKMKSEAWRTNKYEFEVACMTPDKNFPNNIANRRRVFNFASTPIESEVSLASEFVRASAVALTCSKTNSYSLDIKVTIKYLGSLTIRSKIYDPYAANNDILTNVRGLYHDQTFSDFTFFVKDKEFKIHKNVLAAASPVFLKMFTTNMEESRTNQCRMDHIEPDVFDKLLEYVYKGRLPEDFGDFAKEIYTAADYYQLDRLKQLCKSEVFERLSVANALETYKWACRYDLDDLKCDSWEVVKR